MNGDIGVTVKYNELEFYWFLRLDDIVMDLGCCLYCTWADGCGCLLCGVRNGGDGEILGLYIHLFFGGQTSPVDVSRFL